MAFLTSVGFIAGKIPMLILCLLVGLLCVDELLVNFSRLDRKAINYKFTMIIFALFFIVLNILFDAKLSIGFFTIAAIFLNIFLVYYLFKIPLEDEFMKKNSLKNPELLCLIVALPLLSIGIHFHTIYWRKILSTLLIVNFSMDTGAWFFGKNFGKNKLWPEISPKKTIEGLLGGMLTSAILGTICWKFLFKEFQWDYSVVFALCGAISQVGDLVQSKIKREFGIKDSSQLIPGHGGIYDRIDSLIFLSPFFAIVVKYLGRHLPL